MNPKKKKWQIPTLPAFEKNSYTYLSFAFKQIFKIVSQDNKSDLKSKLTKIIHMPNAFDYLVSKYGPLIPFRVSHFLLFLFISSARNEKNVKYRPKKFTN